MKLQSPEPQVPPIRSPKQFVLRLPEGLRERVKQAADASRRSMNAEMVLHIEQGLNYSTQLKGEQQ